jgi:hypothetical protein
VAGGSEPCSPSDEVVSSCTFDSLSKKKISTRTREGHVTHRHVMFLASSHKLVRRQIAVREREL